MPVAKSQPYQTQIKSVLRQTKTAQKVTKGQCPSWHESSTPTPATECLPASISQRLEWAIWGLPIQESLGYQESSQQPTLFDPVSWTLLDPMTWMLPFPGSFPGAQVAGDGKEPSFG